MFLGSYQYRVDNKGRVTLAPPFRAALRENHEDTIIITLFDKCLIAFPLDVMLRLGNQLRQFPFMQQDVIAFKRYFFSRAHQCQPDKLGRILIPPKLREFAGITNEAVQIGILEHIEIWNPSALDHYLEEGREDFGRVSDAFAQILFNTGSPAPDETPPATTLR